MATKVMFFVLFILFTSCNSNKEHNADYLEINNKVLENEIIKYTHYTDSLDDNNPFIIWVCINQINDSTKRFVIMSATDASLFIDIPYHFICNIENREVFFTDIAVLSEKCWDKKNFFNLKQSAHLEVMKKYFPKDYEKYLFDIERTKQGKEVEVITSFYDPVNCYLTFIHDKLAKKEMKRGSFK